MPICVPMRELKDTAKFTALVEENRDVTVTKNGYDSLHCLSNEEYQVLKDEAARAKLLAHIMQAEKEIARGEYVEYDDFAAEIRSRYGLQA